MDKPIISVILSLRNEEKYVKETINSILIQTFSKFELIVINDGSTDNTRNILAEYVSQDSRVKIIDNEVSIGIAKSVNKALDFSQGTYIARIDAGDTSVPERFQKQFEFMEAHPDIFVLGSSAYITDSCKTIVGEWVVPCEVNDKILYQRNGVIQPTVLIRKDLFLKIGKYNPVFSRAEDYELWARTLKNKLKISNLQECLSFVSDRPEGISKRYVKAMMKDAFLIKIKYLPYFFNFCNLISTLRSLIGIFIPLFVFNYVAVRYSQTISSKKFFKQAKLYL